MKGSICNCHIAGLELSSKLIYKTIRTSSFIRRSMQYCCNMVICSFNQIGWDGSGSQNRSDVRDNTEVSGDTKQLRAEDLKFENPKLRAKDQNNSFLLMRCGEMCEQRQSAMGRWHRHFEVAITESQTCLWAVPRSRTSLIDFSTFWRFPRTGSSFLTSAPRAAPPDDFPKVIGQALAEIRFHFGDLHQLSCNLWFPWADQDSEIVRISDPPGRMVRDCRSQWSSRLRLHSSSPRRLQV
jgi:hypothetical protein